MLVTSADRDSDEPQFLRIGPDKARRGCDGMVIVIGACQPAMWHKSREGGDSFGRDLPSDLQLGGFGARRGMEEAAEWKQKQRQY